MQNQGCDKKTADFLLTSWGTGTRKVYNTYLNQWNTFCIIHKINKFNPAVFEVCKFLRSLSERNLSFGAVNAARCALSVLLPTLKNGNTMGKHYWVTRACKSAYKIRPPVPKYPTFWDVSIVFNMIKSWGKNEFMCFEMLAKKLVILILLVTGQRGQLITALLLSELIWTHKGCARFQLKTLMKTAKTGQPLEVVVLDPYPQQPLLCVVATLKAYLKATAGFRIKTIKGKIVKYDKLMLSYRFPNKPIGRDSVSRWVLWVLRRAKISKNFRAHSLRGAGTSKAAKLGVGINELLNYGSWRSEKTMARHYQKDIETGPGKSVSQAILDDA